MSPLLDAHALLDGLAGPAGLKLALALLHFVWQGVLIAAVAAVLMQLVGRRSPQRRYAVGVAGMVLMAVAPIVTFGLVTPPAMQQAEPVPLADTSDLLLDLERFDALLTTLDAPLNETPVIAPPAVRLSWPERLRLIQPYAVLLWLAGALLCGLRLVIGAHASVRCRRGRRSLPEDWLNSVVKAAGRIGVTSPRVFVSDNVAEAITVGLLRPMVLLPAAWIGRIPPDVLEAVLAHELAHLRRHDLWVNLFQRVVESLLFYHPAVWWLSRRIRIEREYCCDNAAAAAVAGRAAYARALEYVATERVAAGRTELFQAALAAGMRGGDSMALLNRVRRVLGVEDRPPFRPRLSEGLLVLAVPAALWAGIATVGPALAQEKVPKAPAEANIPKDSTDVEWGGPNIEEELLLGIATDSERRTDDGLHDALRELREEMKSLRQEVEELRFDTKQGRSTSDHVQGLWPDYMAAWKVRDEAYRQVLLLAKAQPEDPTYVRFVRERYREAETRLAKLHERIEQIDPKLLESKGVNYRVVTESVQSEDGTTNEIKRMVRINKSSPAPDTTGGLPTRADNPSAQSTGGKPPVAPGEGFGGQLADWLEMGEGLDRIEVVPTESGERDAVLHFRDPKNGASHSIHTPLSRLPRALILALPDADRAMRELPPPHAAFENDDRPVTKDGQPAREVHQTERIVKLHIDGKEVPVVIEKTGPFADDPEEIRLRVLKTAEPGARVAPQPESDAPGKHGADPAEIDESAGPPKNSDATEQDQFRFARALGKPVRLSFHDTPLRHVAQTLRNITEVDFLLDEPGLAEEGLTADTPVTIELHDVTALHALTMILKPLNLGYTTDKNIIEITSARRTKGPLVVETYIVADLVRPELPGLDVLSPVDRHRTIDLSPVLEQQLATRIDMLIDIITGTIEPGSWEEVGGWGVIRRNETTQSLVVRQTHDVHEKVRQLLAQLRSARRGDFGPLRSDINRTHKSPPKPPEPASPKPPASPLVPPNPLGVEASRDAEIDALKAEIETLKRRLQDQSRDFVR